VTLDALNK